MKRQYLKSHPKAVENFRIQESLARGEELDVIIKKHPHLSIKTLKKRKDRLSVKENFESPGAQVCYSATIPIKEHIDLHDGIDTDAESLSSYQEGIIVHTVFDLTSSDSNSTVEKQSPGKYYHQNVHTSKGPLEVHDDLYDAEKLSSEENVESPKSEDSYFETSFGVDLHEFTPSKQLISSYTKDLSTEQMVYKRLGRRST
jgi:hypothetical protein